MIYDCFTFRDELDVLELRLKILDKVVDKFVICEANKTFTNQLKPYFYLDNVERFKKWWGKIIYLPVELDPGNLDFSLKDKEYTPSSPAWSFEYQQRNALIYGLDTLEDDALVLMGDLDEIPNPQDIRHYPTPTVFSMGFFYYYINNKSIGPRDPFWLGTSLTKGEFIKKISSIQHLRDIKNNFTVVPSGWHLSYLGGEKMIKNKIQSFSHTEFNDIKYWNKPHINKCLQEGKDIFNREGMNFSIKDLKETYPQEILEIMNNYPQFIYEIHS